MPVAGDANSRNQKPLHHVISNGERNLLSHKPLVLALLTDEETRVHLHVQCGNGEAKFRLEPGVFPEKTHRRLETTL